MWTGTDGIEDHMGAGGSACAPGLPAMHGVRGFGTPVRVDGALCPRCGVRYSAREFYPRSFCGNPNVYHRYCQTCQDNERRRWSLKLMRYMNRLVREGVITVEPVRPACLPPVALSERWE